MKLTITPHAINKDLDPRLLTDKMARHKVNLRSGTSDSDNVGVNENIKTNLKVNNPYGKFFSETEKSLGWVDDIKNDSIIYFLTNGIYRYYPIYDRIDHVVQVSLHHKVDAEIIDDLLCWTDNHGEPKKINIIRAQAYSNPYSPGIYYPKQIVEYQGGAYIALVETNKLPTTSDWKLLSDHAYTSLQEEDMMLIKPTLRESVSISRALADDEYLRGKALQFAKRYIYHDGEKSVLSDYSKVIYTPKTYDDPLWLIPDLDITVRASNAYISPDVKHIQILVRQLDADYAWGKWCVWATQDYPGVDIKYTGVETGIYIDDEEAYVPYHNVPKRAACICSVDEGRMLAFANYIDGFDQVELNVDLKVVPLATNDPSNEAQYELMNRDDIFHCRYQGKFGIVYKGNGRVSPVYTNDSLNIKINKGVLNFSGIQFKINHLAPEWATSYSWVRTRDFSSDGYFFWKLENTEFELTPGLGYKIPMTKMIDYKIKHNITYDVKVGDKFKFMGAASYISEKTVTAVDDSNFYLDSISYNLANDQPPLKSDYQIWHPTSNDGDNSIYYEFGDTYLIENRNHHANHLNQESYGYALGTFRQGNTFYMRRRVDNDYVYANTINKFDSAFALPNAVGKPNVENKESKERHYLNHIKKSSVYFSDTKINGLNEFDFKSTPLNEKYGEITKMIEVGVNTLKVTQRGKLASIYLGKEVIKSGNDQDVLATTNQTFGTIRTPEETWGTIFKDSVVKNNRNLFFYDIYAGVVLRDSPNGLYPISNYGMSNEFKTLSKSLLTSGLQNIDIIATFDAKHEEYLITFVDRINISNNQTWCFHEPSNSWTYQHTEVPEMWAARGQFVVLFKNGELYKKEYGDSYYPCSLTAVFNAEPLRYKTFRSSMIDGNGQWESEITVDADETNKRGMYTRLKKGKYKYKNGTQVAPYMRDMLTKSLTPSLDMLLNGREIRGRYITQTFSCDDQQEVTLAAVSAEVQINQEDAK